MAFSSWCVVFTWRICNFAVADLESCFLNQSRGELRLSGEVTSGFFAFLKVGEMG